MRANRTAARSSRRPLPTTSSTGAISSVLAQEFVGTVGQDETDPVTICVSRLDAADDCEKGQRSYDAIPARFHSAHVIWQLDGDSTRGSRKKRSGLSGAERVRGIVVQVACAVAAVDAVNAMRNSGCGCTRVPADATTREVVGVVNKRDACCSVAADDRRASEVSVAEIMRSATACRGVEDSLDAAREQLQEHHATRLPVVDQAGCCGGTVSVHRLAHA